MSRELGVTAANGKIYAIGGINSYTCLGTVEEYDPSSDIWAEKTQMPTARANFGVVTYHNKIYAIGGTTGSGAQERYGHGIDYSKINVSGVNEVYDFTTNTWETRAPMPTPRMGVSASVVNEKIYLIGGFEQGGKSTDVTQVYDPETDSWETKASLLTSVGGHASAVVNNTLYIFGGSKQWMSGYGNDRAFTQVYSPENDSWVYKSPSPVSPAFPVAGSTTGVVAPMRIYIISYPNITQVYDPQSDTWSVGIQMSTNRCTFGVAVVDDLLYVVGGGSAVFPTIYFFGYNEQYMPFGYGTITQVFPSPIPTSTSPLLASSMSSAPILLPSLTGDGMVVSSTSPVKTLSGASIYLPILVALAIAVVLMLTWATIKRKW